MAAQAQQNTKPGAIGSLLEFSMLGLVATGFAALAGSGYIDTPSLVLTSVGFLLRLAALCGVNWLRFSARQATVAAIAYLVFLPLDYYLISRDLLLAAVHAVCFLAAARVLTAATGRDYLVTGAVSLLEILAAAVLATGSGFLLWLGVYVFFAVTTLAAGQIHHRMEQTRRGGFRVEEASRGRLAPRVVMVAVAAALATLLMTAGLFFIVPRTVQRASRFMPASRRVTGFSNVVDLGGFGAVARDDRPVMHFRIYSPSPPRDVDWSALKWRGATLSRFDGRRWSERPAMASAITAAPGIAVVAERRQLSRRDGERVLYSVDVSNAGNGTLFLAGIPEFINIDSRVLLGTSSGVLRSPASPRETLRYQVSAFLGPPLEAPLSEAERNRYLQIPALDRRVLALAASWAGEGTDGERAERIARHLRGEYRYVLEGPPREVADPLADFLLRRKAGYCEYFASAMAVMLRTQGIPSRVITGFGGSYFNEVTGQHVVRASDAHAWVEAYLPAGKNGGAAWVTFDPTPAAPEGAPGGFISRLAMYEEAVSDVWREWVLFYDLGHQATAMAQIREAGARIGTAKWWSSAGRPLLWVAAISSLIVLLALAAPRLARRWHANPWLAKIRYMLRRGSGAHTSGQAAEAAMLYGRMLTVLENRGFPKPASVTPREFAQLLPPAERRLATIFTEVYNGLRFGGETASTARLQALLTEFDAL